MSDSESTISNLTIESLELPNSTSKPSRGERKARKLLLQGSPKYLENVSRVVFRQNDGSLYVIDSPEVYKQPKADTYIVFGKVIVSDSNVSQMQAAKAAMELNNHIKATVEQQLKQKQEQIEFDVVAGDDDGEEKGDGPDELDETGLNSLDIELVMSQAGVSKRKAIQSLRENDNDLVNTIMNLTM